MKQYGLGPNGGITTSLNLFATRFDQVMGLLERRADDLDYVFVDTPGMVNHVVYIRSPLFHSCSVVPNMCFIYASSIRPD